MTGHHCIAGYEPFLVAVVSLQMYPFLLFSVLVMFRQPSTQRHASLCLPLLPAPKDLGLLFVTGLSENVIYIVCSKPLLRQCDFRSLCSQATKATALLRLGMIYEVWIMHRQVARMHRVFVQLRKSHLTQTPLCPPACNPFSFFASLSGSPMLPFSLPHFSMCLSRPSFTRTNTK